MSAFSRDQWLSRFLPLFLLLLLIPYLLNRIYTRLSRAAFARHHGCLEPHATEPVKDPFIGLDFIYQTISASATATGAAPAFLEPAHQAFQTLGTTYVSRRWTWEAVFTSDALNVKHLLATAFEDFHIPTLRISAMAGLLGSGIFTLNGHSWAAARSVLRTALARQDKASSIQKLERYFQAMLRRLPGEAGEAGEAGRGVVDLQPLFFWLAMDFATDFLMGRSANTLDADADADGDSNSDSNSTSSSSRGRVRAEQFAADYVTCSIEVLHKMRLGPLQAFSFDRAAHRAKRRVFRYIDDLIDESLVEGGAGGGEEKGPGADEEKGAGEERTVLRELAAMTGDRKQLRDQILHILLAGRDTTACLLSNLFFMLSRRPGVYEKLRSEVLRVAGEEPASAEQLQQMQYLKWCVQESLRMHPVIPANARQAVRDAILPRGGGPDGQAPLLVKQGTVVVFNIYSMQRDEAVFGGDPAEFIPERWEGLKPGWSYLPFNGGPRICLGQRFALLETHFIVSRMVQVFERMEAVDDEPWRELYALATTCENGVNVRLA